MNLAQQKQIDLLKKRVDHVEKTNKHLVAENAEINRQLSLFLNNFQTHMAKAIDKVIADGIVAERSTESQIRELLHNEPTE
jgi:uncharacterized membrane-anchored protein YhcB (DUF1043 family)